MYIVHTLAVGYIVNRAKVQFQLIQIFFQLPVLLSSKVDDKGAQHTYKAHHRIKKKCLMTKSFTNWSKPNQLFLLALHLSLHCTKDFTFYCSNSALVTRYFKFCNEDFVDFLNSYRFYYFGALTLLRKSCLCSKKLFDAVV